MRNHRAKKNKESANSPPSTHETNSSTAKPDKRRYCRAGTGYEKTPNACDTPGFQLRSDHAITRDDRDFLKLEMKRNNLRMIQTPLNVLRGWRGNCDIKVLLYDCHDSEPTPEDIAEVTDYVVACACKGAKETRHWPPNATLLQPSSIGECCVGCKCAKTGPIPFEYPRVFKKNLIPRLFPFIVSFSRCNARMLNPLIRLPVLRRYQEILMM